MNIKIVPIGRGLDWITEGFGLFRQNPLIWIVNFVIFLAIVMLLSLLPFLGPIAVTLSQPVLVGGMLLGCRALEQGGELRIEHLFDGFGQHAQPLLMVGLLSGAAYVLIGVVVWIMLVGAMGLGALAGLAEQSALAVAGAMVGFIFYGLIGLTLTLPVVMATWFAPALVVFGKLPALEAMKASFSACLRNTLPFLLRHRRFAAVGCGGDPRRLGAAGAGAGAGRLDLHGLPGYFRGLSKNAPPAGLPAGRFWVRPISLAFSQWRRPGR
jgi:uncharacterized membrane protein